MRASMERLSMPFLKLIANSHSSALLTLLPIPWECPRLPLACIHVLNYQNPATPSTKATHFRLIAFSSEVYHFSLFYAGHPLYVPDK
jgi:hypothetical protein